MIGSNRRLHPAFRAAVDHILRDMKVKGWDPIIGSGLRSAEEQQALYAQGRESLNHVNNLRLRAKLPPIRAQENSKVTRLKSGMSYHNVPEMLVSDGSGLSKAYGYAVDIVDRRKGWDIADQEFWKDLGALAKQYGCEWGGDWKKPDPAHVQMALIDSARMTTVPV
jgi:peptidoglycan L-alanyl-D-glutamate endopeptidase CwlK